MIYNSIIETIGNTPLVKLQKVAKGIPGTILAKVEYFNPGNSTKDRMALKMRLHLIVPFLLQAGADFGDGGKLP